MKNIIKKFNKNSIAVLAVKYALAIAGLVIVTTISNLVALAATSVNLGAAGNFAVLAGSTITNTGSSVINGNLGISPGSAVTGFPPGIINGTQEITNSAASQAQTDLITAYNNAAGQTPVSTIPAELGGTTKTAGVYDTAPAGTFEITGTLTLDAAGDPSSVFIFKTASTLITAGASNVVLTNGAQACNVFWQVGSSATLGTNSTFKGNILALTSATLTTGANVEGRVLARNGAITLDTNTITRATCAPVTPVTPTPIPSSGSTTIFFPAPASTPSSTLTSTPISTPSSSTPTQIPSSGSASTPAPSSTPSSGSTSTPSYTSTISPKLPNAGIDPEDKSNTSTWGVIIPAGIFAVLFSFYLVQIRQPK